MQKQTGGQDCGLFAIAAATAILFSINMTDDIVFIQNQMRLHLFKCCNDKLLTMSPIATVATYE